MHNINFGDALGSPHNITGFDDLVGRDHRKLKGAETGGQVGGVLRTLHVGFDSLGLEAFHNGHVFAGGGVEDVFRLVQLEETLHLVVVLHVADDRVEQAALDLSLQGDADLCQGRFRLVEADDTPGSVTEQLAGDLAADGPSADGDQHYLIVNALPDAFVVQLDGRAVKQVLETDILKLPDVEAVIQPVLGRRHLQHLDVVDQAVVDELDAPFFRQLVDAYDGYLDVVFANHFGKGFLRVEHFEPIERFLVDFGVIVKKSHCPIVVRAL